MSHSKRNTSRAVFTAHERSLAKAAWTVSTARLTRESFLPFGACALCLEPAQDPVACPSGDVFCRECALRNLLAQKQELQRQDRLRAQAEREREERRVREDAEDEARAVAEFELVQAGLGEARSRGGRQGGRGGGGGGGGGSEAEPSAPASSVSTTTTTPSSPPRKRKFELDDDDLQRVMDADRARARRAIEADRAAARDATALPSFWAPSVTPSSNKGVVIRGGSSETNGDSKATSLLDSASTSATAAATATATATATALPRHTVCPASHDGHAFSLRTLVALQFAEDAAGQRICPACKRTLSNASRAVLARPCGHVLCRNCVHQFVRPLKGAGTGAGAAALLFDPHAPEGTAGLVRCYVCEADLTEEVEGQGNDEPAEGKRRKKDKKDKHKKEKKDKERIRPGLVELRSEGTGFSAGGASEVKKNGVAFQC